MMPANTPRRAARGLARDAADEHVVYVTSAALVNDPEQHRADSRTYDGGAEAFCSCGWSRSFTDEPRQ